MLQFHRQSVEMRVKALLKKRDRLNRKIDRLLAPIRLELALICRNKGLPPELGEKMMQAYLSVDP